MMQCKLELNETKKRGEGKEEYQENGAKRKRQTTGDTNKCVNIN